ncbi:MAG TPA: thymidine phosphorylase [Planctomycetes bacterium]|nr:thymidine phosphorylase [Planctomycetota bacterium]
MDIRELIRLKTSGEEFTPEAIDFFVRSLVDGTCTDEQLGALLMAFYFQGLTAAEIRVLTERLAHSGRTLGGRRAGIPRLDKHSTGGVGDKVSLVLAPLVAACGAQVPMISARGLLHTGGTLDKLESIPGFRVNLSHSELEKVLEKAGLFIAGATDEFVPAEKRLYQARDATETVDSIPLITASILSKKLAEDLDALVLDVKVGTGAFMPDQRSALALARRMITTASALGLKAVALVTSMDEPLGRTVGNALEVREALEFLKGGGTQDLKALVFSLGAELLVQGGLAEDVARGREMLERVLARGKGLEKFRAMVEAQGGDPRVVEDPSLLPRAPVVVKTRADQEGYVTGIHAKEVGLAVVDLGAGRKRWTDPVDPACGVVLLKKVGESVSKGEPFFEIHARTEGAARRAQARVMEAIQLNFEGITHERWVLNRVEGGL